ncbi:MAG: reverse transcriptase-like protein [Demequinaceae bacterium]|nr:reverse transcriptase-like protein [Demequinaceae bacterium]
MRVLVVEADGGSRGNPGPAGYGALVRDGATGEVLAERAGFLGVATNNVAEYRGLIAGLRAAREIDPRAYIDVRLDSRLLVHQMKGEWKVKHPDMKALHAEARKIVRDLHVTFAWAPRAENTSADALANEAMDAEAVSIRRGLGAEDAGAGNAGCSDGGGHALF